MHVREEIDILISQIQLKFCVDNYIYTSKGQWMGGRYVFRLRIYMTNSASKYFSSQLYGL